MLDAEGELLEDLARGRDRLGEDRLLVGEAVGHPVEIRAGYGDVLRHGAVGVEDAQDASIGAVSLPSLRTQLGTAPSRRS